MLLPQKGSSTWSAKTSLFRCAHPTQLTTHGATTLRNLGITNIYDLRSLPEIDKLAHTPPSTPSTSEKPVLDTSNGYIIIPSIPRLFTPVYAREDYSPVALARKLQWYTSPNAPDEAYSAGFVNAYRDIATYAASGGAYSTILRQALKSARNMKGNPALGRRRRPTEAVAGLDWLIGYQEGDEKVGAKAGEGEKGGVDGGLIFHCTAGKDRTGVLAAVVLRLLGVDDDTICWEYAITEPGLGSWRDLFIERISKGGLGGPSRDTATSRLNAGKLRDEKEAQDKKMDNMSPPTGPSQRLMSRAEAARICSSRAANMRAFLTQVLDGEFGGAEKYLMEMVGLGREEVEGLKEDLVVEVKEEGEVVEVRGIKGWSLERGMEADYE